MRKSKGKKIRNNSYLVALMLAASLAAFQGTSKNVSANELSEGDYGVVATVTDAEEVQEETVSNEEETEESISEEEISEESNSEEEASEESNSEEVSGENNSEDDISEEVISEAAGDEAKASEEVQPETQIEESKAEAEKAEAKSTAAKTAENTATKTTEKTTAKTTEKTTAKITEKTTAKTTTTTKTAAKTADKTAAKPADKSVKVVTSIAEDIPAVPSVTIYEGIDYSRVYDYDFYLAKNPDVLRAYNGDPEKTLEHFVKYGMREGRYAKESFSINSYIKANPDLRRAFGYDKAKYYDHFVRRGYWESRVTAGADGIKDPVTVYNGVDYSKVYNYDFYINLYPDLKRVYGNDPYADVEALEHFIKYGMRERRTGSSTFDVRSYINSYRDLRVAFGEDAAKYYTHYMTYGLKENRKTHGEKTLQNPVNVYGGKDYSLVYDYNFYINRYADLKNYAAAKVAPDVALLEHFVNHGMGERRQGSDRFDMMSYYRSHRDLRVAFHKDYAKYYVHYIDYGARERRKPYGEKTLQNPVTVYDGVDFSSVYDYYYYTTINPDIKNKYGEDDIDVLHHFVRWGISEGRKSKAVYDQAAYDSLKEKARELVAEEIREEEMARRRAQNPTAAGVLDRIGWTLSAAYNYAASLDYYGKTLFDASWGSYNLAQYGFENGKGNCYVMAGVFYELAKMLDYEIHQIAGFIPLINGGETAHSWCEVVQDGEIYVCDPNLTQSRGNDAFMKPYGSKGIWVYQHYYRMN